MYGKQLRLLAASGEATSVPMTKDLGNVMNKSDDTGGCPRFQAFYRTKVKKSHFNKKTGCDFIRTRAFLRPEFMEL